MKKIIILILVLFMLCGCQTKKEEVIEEEPEIVEDDRPHWNFSFDCMPKELETCYLSKEELDALDTSLMPEVLASKITTVAEAFQFFMNNHFPYTRDNQNILKYLDGTGGDDFNTARVFAFLLEGDYEEIGLITLTNEENDIIRFLIYVMKNNYYYPIDTSLIYGDYENFYGWLMTFDGKPTRTNSLDELLNSLKPNDGRDYVVESKVLYTGLYDPYPSDWKFNDTRMPVELRQCHISIVDLNELYNEEDINVVAEKITTVAEAVQYFMNKRFPTNKDQHDIRKFLNGEGGNEKEAAEAFAFLLDGDYEEIGTISLTNTKDRVDRSLMYVLQDGLYFPIDTSLMYGDFADFNAWLGPYGGNPTKCESLEELCSSLNPIDGRSYIVKSKVLYEEQHVD